MAVSTNVPATTLRPVSSISWTVVILAILTIPNVLDAAEATPAREQRDVPVEMAPFRAEGQGCAGLRAHVEKVSRG